MRGDGPYCFIKVAHDVELKSILSASNYVCEKYPWSYNFQYVALRTIHLKLTGLTNDDDSFLIRHKYVTLTDEITIRKLVPLRLVINKSFCIIWYLKNQQHATEIINMCINKGDGLHLQTITKKINLIFDNSRTQIEYDFLLDYQVRRYMYVHKDRGAI